MQIIFTTLSGPQNSPRLDANELRSTGISQNIDKQITAHEAVDTLAMTNSVTYFAVILMICARDLEHSCFRAKENRLW